MFCAISGEIPEEPVVSRKSGLLFEKRLIEKALKATGGKCPETGEDLTSDDLISVKTSGKHARPISSSATSFPALLQHLQSEWDSLMLESHSVKKSLNKTKQELAHALYQCDAATRVISRLLEEKQELKNALTKPIQADPETRSGVKRKSSQLEQSSENGIAAANTIERDDVVAEQSKTMEADNENSVESQIKRRKDSTQVVAESVISEKEPTEPKTFPAELLQKIEKQSEGLRTRRKARKLSKELVQISDLKSFVDSRQSTPETESPSTCILLMTAQHALAGYESGKVSILHAETLETLQNRDLQHTSAHGGVTCLARSQSSNPGIFVSGGGDGCVRVWDYSKSLESAEARYVANEGSGIVDIDFHPNNSVLFSCTRNGSWTWRDLETNKVLSTKGGGRDIESIIYRSGKVHPDGILFATGCANGSLEMWDVRSMKSLANLAADWSAGSVGVSGLSMSENGYYLGAAVNGTVAIWDLRGQKIAKEIKVEENGGIMNVCIDHSGLYGCAVSTSKHVIFSTKKKGGIVKEEVYAPSKKADDSLWRRPGVAWYPDAKALLTGRTSGEVHRYSVERGQ